MMRTMTGFRAKQQRVQWFGLWAELMFWLAAPALWLGMRIAKRADREADAKQEQKAA